MLFVTLDSKEFCSTFPEDWCLMDLWRLWHALEMWYTHFCILAPYSKNWLFLTELLFSQQHFLLLVIVLRTCPHMLCLGIVLTTLLNLELAKYLTLILLSLQHGFGFNWQLNILDSISGKLVNCASIICYFYVLVGLTFVFAHHFLDIWKLEYKFLISV